jgi:hypothetical protein
VANTLAYYNTAKITAVKSFIAQDYLKIFYLKITLTGEQTRYLLKFSFALFRLTAEPLRFLANFMLNLKGLYRTNALAFLAKKVFIKWCLHYGDNRSKLRLFKNAKKYFYVP